MLKKYIRLRIDADVLDWFKAQGDDESRRPYKVGQRSLQKFH